MRSYLKFLSRNKLYTAIEFIGLAVSLAFVILIGCYVWQQYAVTRENPDGKRIYVPGTPEYPGLTMGFPEVVSKIPEVETVSRLVSMSMIDGENEYLMGGAVDRSFFDMFPGYRFLAGNADVISTKSNVILSESYARKRNLSLGDRLTLNREEYTVAAIVEDRHGTVLHNYDAIQSVDVYEDFWPPFDGFGTISFIRVRPGTERQSLYEKIEAVCKEVYPYLYGQPYFDHLELPRYDELFFKDTLGTFRHGDLKSIRTLSLVGLLLLLSSIFNYVNLSVALTGKRAKEMAVRLLAGASKGRIIGKYIAESVLFTAACFAAGLLLAEVFCPMLNRLLVHPDIPVRIVWSPGYILAYAGLVVIVGVISGIIPALMAGRYNALEVMKGGYRRKSKMVFSKVFIVLQNALSVVLIVWSMTMEAQMRKTQSRPLHFNTEDVFIFAFSPQEDPAPFKDALERLPCVKRIGKCDNLPGSETGSAPFAMTKDGRPVMYQYYAMDSTAFRIFGFDILEDYGAPVINSVWFTDESFAVSGLDSDDHDISALMAPNCEQLAGIIKAFPTSESNMGEEGHAIVSVVRPEDIWIHNYVIETIGDREDARRSIMATYEDYAKDRSVVLNYPQDWYDGYLANAYEPARNNMRMVEFFMLLSILVSLLGLVAMSTYYADEKTGDIAVRKVFGGTVETEAWRSVRDYMLLVGIACAIGVPIAVYVVQEYLKHFIYRLDGYWWIFVAAIFLSAFMAFLSVFWQTIKAAKTNPAAELKKE